MNVDDAVPEGLNDRGGNPLHVAGKDDEIDTVLLKPGEEGLNERCVGVELLSAEVEGG